MTLIFFLYSPCFVIGCHFHYNSFNSILRCQQERCLSRLRSQNCSSYILFGFSYKYTSTFDCHLNFFPNVVLCNCCSCIIVIHCITLCCARIKQVSRDHYTRSLNNLLFYVQDTKKIEFKYCFNGMK